jgi:hypothetical protein
LIPARVIKEGIWRRDNEFRGCCESALALALDTVSALSVRENEEKLGHFVNPFACLSVHQPRILRPINHLKAKLFLSICRRFVTLSLSFLSIDTATMKNKKRGMMVVGVPRFNAFSQQTTLILMLLFSLFISKLLKYMANEQKSNILFHFGSLRKCAIVYKKIKR